MYDMFSNMQHRQPDYNHQENTDLTHYHTNHVNYTGLHTDYTGCASAFTE